MTKFLRTLVPLFALLVACAHAPMLRDGVYDIESVRQKYAPTGGFTEISGTGVKLLDKDGKEVASKPAPTIKGQLILNNRGACFISVAVTYGPDEVETQDTQCKWSVKDDKFFIADTDGKGTHSAYKITRIETGEPHIILDGLFEAGKDGLRDSMGEGSRIVLFHEQRFQKVQPVKTVHFQ